MPGSTDANFSDNFSVLSYSKPKQRCPKWLYDCRTGAFLGRTSRSWCLIVTFYMIFFAVLAAFFMGMMLTFMYYIVPTDQPLRTGQHSLLKLTPGLGVRPSMDVKNTLITYSYKDPQTYVEYVQNIDAFLNTYYDLNSKKSENLATCSNGKKVPDDVNKVCKFQLTDLGPCNKDNEYGYKTNKPCVILKLNKIFGWLPNIQENSTVSHPLVRCTGQNPLDGPNIGVIKFYPEAKLDNVAYGKFDSSFYPYIGQVSYLSPLVAVQFESLKPHTAVLIQCEVHNVKTDTYSDAVKFEMMID